MGATEPGGQDVAWVPLEALLELARSASEDSLPRVLESVTETILRLAGFRTVVLNVFRPAWDDFEAVLVKGGQESRELLLGTTAPREVVLRLLDKAQERFPDVYLLTDRPSAWEEFEVSYRPEILPVEDPGHWDPEDGLLVMLRDAAGRPVGLMSMDEPTSGRRPGDRDLRLVAVICSYAQQALRSAQRSEQVEREKQALAHLTVNSPRLTACETLQELYGLTAQIVAELGYERVAIYGADGGGQLVLREPHGPGREASWARGLTGDRVGQLLDPAHEHSGCWLVGADRLSARQERTSARNGAGPLAWDEHCLLIPWHDERRNLAGLVVIEDPVDRLLPTDEQLRVLRLVVDLAASVQLSIQQRLQLTRLAGQDALTGLHNRRDLDRLITGSPGAALLLCDLDHFKQINDRHGHHTGDRVLARFGQLLQELARDQDIAIRLGGEEFCLVLAHTDQAGAIVAAERLRHATRQQLAAVVPGGVTVSIGVAVGGSPPLDAGALFARADRELYHAKRTGRDRISFAQG